MIRYGSVCSGIEAASVAWHPLGWRASFLSEIEAFPRAVLQHHYPTVPLHGDFTTIEAGQYDAIDLLVGGTPCQDFSVAGLRAGMAGDRGNLTLQFLTLARRLRPRWVVWENVPGVLSSNGGRDFGSFLGGLGELGYGWAYRTLDARYFGLAQKRSRVFVVGSVGDWRPAAAALFERAAMDGSRAPFDAGREDVAPTLRARANFSYRADTEPLVVVDGRARRLTCVEWERLQGFPDNHTRIPWRGRPANDCPDGLRRTAIGNSMPVPVMAWIGRRIEAVEALVNPAISAIQTAAE